MFGHGTSAHMPRLEKRTFMQEKMK